MSRFFIRACTPTTTRPARRGAGPPARLPRRRPESANLPGMANIVFSLCAAVACLVVAILAAAKGAPVVALVWGLLAVGFAIRAAYGHARTRRR
ncbi:MAG TPA: hypothetical protein VN672_06645 [Solirubrobacteraceae bacterium]|nr:hypothetical protein [Solirubrobacteraceae bacterium]